MLHVILHNLQPPNYIAIIASYEYFSATEAINPAIMQVIHKLMCRCTVIRLDHHNLSALLSVQEISWKFECLAL